ncbi:MAG: hypothetical protein ALECFALPRED_001158 [Alectoria fallacina]|uniref:Uncharacterized protein n=1 Tax=Alectoria fallacina TaxID=1903189 RepID=A0A8H3JB30_9LECA|nr:MAG: hypothetical protein ALECFALPRED_001158 [Alectoria fallacina]
MKSYRFSRTKMRESLLGLIQARWWDPGRVSVLLDLKYFGSLLASPAKLLEDNAFLQWHSVSTRLTLSVMAMVRTPTFDISTPEKMAAWIRKNETAHPNVQKPVHAIRPDDIVYLDDHPCLMSDPPKISHLDSLSGEGYEDEKDDKLIVVFGISVIDGKEYGQLYSEGEEVRYFVDDHDEREWLVTGREGMRVFLQAPGDPSDTWTLWMQREKRIPCVWLLARCFPGKVYFKVYRALGLDLVTGVRDAPGFSA